MKTPFYSEATSREALHEARYHDAEQLIEVLDSELLAREIEANNITVALIRPGIEDETFVEATDPEVAFAIEEEIGDLGVLAKFAVQFDEATVLEWYQGKPYEVQIEQPPIRDDVETRWDEFMGIMTAGPTTVLLLHDVNGKAIERWREQVGHYDITNRRDPATIRGKLGKGTYNNLIHGSDSPEAVAREVAMIRRMVANSVA